MSQLFPILCLLTWGFFLHTYLSFAYKQHLIGFYLVYTVTICAFFFPFYWDLWAHCLNFFLHCCDKILLKTMGSKAVSSQLRGTVYCGRGVGWEELAAAGHTPCTISGSRDTNEFNSQCPFPIMQFANDLS